MPRSLDLKLTPGDSLSSGISHIITCPSPLRARTANRGLPKLFSSNHQLRLSIECESLVHQWTSITRNS
ncbi:hypothetical protein ACOSQ4_003511 [Xanthoceras sorbifolium]